jgi:hypothetical protein
MPRRAFEANGVEDGARLEVCAWEASFAEVVEDIVALNTHCTVEELTRRATFEADEVTLKDWHLQTMSLVALPESIGSLVVGGDLDLSWNHLGSLPETFSSMTVPPGGREPAFEQQSVGIPSGEHWVLGGGWESLLELQ